MRVYAIPQISSEKIEAIVFPAKAGIQKRNTKHAIKY